VIQQAMLARWLEEFIQRTISLLRDPNRPAPPPLPEPPPQSGQNTLAGVRDFWLQRYSGYTLQCDAILKSHDQLLLAVVGDISGTGPGGVPA
jgi:hypothetical protein